MSKSLRGLVVFHANDASFRDTTFFTKGREDKVIELFNDSQYQPAAHLGSKFGLEDVFRATNHIDSAWTENPGVREINKDTRKRSTSVGDIVLDASERKAYVVASFGFEPLDVEKMNFDEQIGFAQNGIRKDQQRENSLGRSMG